MWNYLFGNTKQKKEMPKKAIVDLREHISTLNKKSNYLESQIKDQEDLARKNISKNKNLAKLCLKKKKKLESDLIKINNQIESLETQLMAIESANLNLETMKAMKQGAKAIKQIHSDFNIDKVDETMDEIRDQVEASEEISEAISRPLGTDFIDEDELDDELAALEEEEAESNLINTHNENIKTQESNKLPNQNIQSSNSINKLPSAPTKKIESSNKKEEEQGEEDEDEDERALRELQAEMGI